MNLLLHKSEHVEFYTYLDSLFDACGELREYEYLITDLEVSYSTDQRLHQDVVTISGEELYEIIKKESVQFIWGVFSAYNKAPLMVRNLPYADGNRQLWEGSPSPQANGALFEIVAWDSGCTLFIGLSDSIAKTLKELYPDIKNLDIENELRTNKSH